LLAPKTILIKKMSLQVFRFHRQCYLRMLPDTMHDETIHEYMTQGFHRCGYSETLTVFPRAIPCDLFPRNLLASRRICKALKLAYRCWFIRETFATHLQKVYLLVSLYDAVQYQYITIFSSHQLSTLIIS